MKHLHVRIYARQLASNRYALATFKSCFEIHIMSDMIIMANFKALGRD